MLCHFCLLHLVTLVGCIICPGWLVRPVGLVEVGVLAAAPLPPHLLLLARLALGYGHAHFDRLLAHPAESVHVN